jgi:hypothetical protein
MDSDSLYGAQASERAPGDSIRDSVPSFLRTQAKTLRIGASRNGLHFLVLALMLVSPIICFVGGKVERDPKSACRAFINNDATPRNTSSIWFFTIFSSKISTSQPQYGARKRSLICPGG